MVLNYINENGIQIFRLDAGHSSFESNWSSVLRAINILKFEGLLFNLQRGLYALPSFSDQNILACQLAPKGGLACWVSDIAAYYPSRVDRSRYFGHWELGTRD